MTVSLPCFPLLPLYAMSSENSFLPSPRKGGLVAWCLQWGLIGLVAVLVILIGGVSESLEIGGVAAE